MEYYSVTAAGGRKGLSDTRTTETSIWKHTPPCPNTANENMPKMSSKPTTFRFFILIETSFFPYFGRCLCLVPPQQSCVILRRHEFSTSCSGLRKMSPHGSQCQTSRGEAQNGPHPCSEPCGTRGGRGSWEEPGHETEPPVRLPIHHRKPTRNGGQRSRSEGGADAAQRSQESARPLKNATACVKGGLCGRKVQLEGVCAQPRAGGH